MTYMSEREILQAGADFTVGKVNGVRRVTLNQDVVSSTKVYNMEVGIFFHDGRTYKAPIPYADWIVFIQEAVSGGAA
jgi:hypothetical protein